MLCRLLLCDVLVLCCGVMGATWYGGCTMLWRVVVLCSEHGVVRFCLCNVVWYCVVRVVGWWYVVLVFWWLWIVSGGVLQW